MTTEIKGKAKGGKALAAKMTKQERYEKAMKMVEAKKIRKDALVAQYRGDIKIGDVLIPCAVLSDGTRVVSELGINSTLGSSGGKNYKLRKETESDKGPLPLFVASKALQPFISSTFDDKDLSPIEYIDGKKISRGYPATILPKVCEIWLKAKDDGTLQDSQLPKAKKAEIMMRGLAKVGVIALVDEATGYQKDREKDALAKILEAFVAKELQPYLKAFPAEYYEELFRLYNLKFPPEKPQWRPSFFGRITNNVIYARLAPELLPELKLSASKIEKKTRLHQWLTNDIGHPKLREHLASIVTIMKLSEDKENFFKMVDKIHPKFNTNYEIDFE